MDVRHALEGDNSAQSARPVQATRSAHSTPLTNSATNSTSVYPEKEKVPPHQEDVGNPHQKEADYKTNPDNLKTKSIDDSSKKPSQPSVANSTPSSYPVLPGIEMSETFPGLIKPIPEKVVFEWVAPSRPFKKRRKQYYTTLGTIVGLLALILFFAGQFLPVAVVLAVAFLAYVLSTIPPHEVKYKITTYGIRLDEQLFYWQELGRYWFDSKFDQDMVEVEVFRFPNRLTLMLGKDVTRKQISDILSEVLLKQKPEPTFFDKASKWLQEKVPLDIEGK